MYLSKLVDKYTDASGLISPNGRPSLNGLRYTAELVTWYMDYHKYSETYEACEFRKKGGKVLSGVWMRSPTNGGGIESIDDYTAIATYAYVTRKTEISKRFLNHWNKNWGYFNQFHPSFDWRGFMIRFPQLKCHHEWVMSDVTGKKPAAWRRAWWGASVFFSTFSKKHDSWVLSWHLCIVGGDAWFENLIRSYFSKRFKMKWPGGVGQVLGEYFRDWSHPNAQGLRYQFGEKRITQFPIPVKQ